MYLPNWDPERDERMTNGNEQDRRFRKKRQKCVGNRMPITVISLFALFKIIT